jgi:hypothetical protein
MKSTLRSNLLTAVQAGLLLFLITATASAADFSVNVPFRAGAGQLQAGRVKITLRMQNPANPGAVGVDQLITLDSVGGSPLGSPRTMTATTVGAVNAATGFRVAFYSLASAPNDVVIDVTFLSKFTTPGNFCVSNTMASFTLALRYNPGGGNTIQSYRLSSYSAPADLIPEQCGCINRRLNTPGAVWASPPPGTDMGRHPYDVVLVLDRSGSMGDPIPAGLSGSDSAIKMNALKEAVKTFIDQWKLEIDAPPDDRLAIVWFETGVTVEAPGNFVRRDSPGGWDALKNAVNAQTTADSTAMGDGVSKGVDLLQDNDVGNDRNIVLLTNGMQNVGNLIIPDAVNPSLHDFFWLNKTPAAGYQPLASMCVPMDAIGVGGAPGDIPIDLLTAISTETGAEAQLPVNSIAMANAFGNSLVNILKGNTMSVLKREEGTLNSGSSQAPPALFNLDSSVRQGIVVLGWSGAGNDNALKLDVFPPSGPTPVFAQQVTTPFYIIKTVELPTSGSPGGWQALVSRTTGNANIPYYVSVYTMEGRFSSRFEFKKADYGTGDDIVLTATLGFGGQPLLGQGNGLSVRVERPESAINTLLHNMNVPDAVLTTQPAGVSTDSYTRPYERKVFDLLKSTTFGQQVEPRADPETFRMLDNGNPANGDAKAGDGIYSMRYPRTRVPGRYRFKVAMNLTTPTGTVNRIEQHDTEVNVLVIDSKQSEVNSTRDLVTPGKYRLDIVPADRFGNFLGPGYADQIQVALVGPGAVSGTVVDERQNGTYTVQLTGVSDAAATRAKIRFRNDEFSDRSISESGKPTRRYAIFAGVGGNFPHGDFGTLFNTGVSAHAGFEYMFTNRVSTELSAGYERFNFAFGSSHLNMGRASANIKFYPVIGTFQFGLFGGGGVYVFNSGDTHGGLNIGAVGEYRLNTTVGLESTYNFHSIFASGQHLNYSTLTGGIRFRF